MTGLGRLQDEATLIVIFLSVEITRPIICTLRILKLAFLVLHAFKCFGILLGDLSKKMHLIKIAIASSYLIQLDLNLNM